jgi:uncharacterized protein (TIGR03382 family)
MSASIKLASTTKFTLSFALSLSAAAPLLADPIAFDDFVSTSRGLSFTGGNGALIGYDRPTTTATAAGFTQRGDMGAIFTRVAENGNTGFDTNAWRGFTVGDLPVRVTISMSANFKIANAGGSNGNPSTSYSTFAFIRDTDSDQLVMATPAIDGSLSGNGITVIDPTTTESAYSFILAPRTRYALGFSFFVTSTTDVPLNTLPTTAVVAEFGGISGYEGFSVTGTFVTVPTPGAAAVAGLGLLAISRRRRV